MIDKRNWQPAWKKSVMSATKSIIRKRCHPSDLPKKVRAFDNIVAEPRMLACKQFHQFLPVFLHSQPSFDSNFDPVCF